MTRLYDAKPFIIAELGSNWRELSDITNAIHLIKAMGADALKLQAFDHQALYGLPPTPKGFTNVGDLDDGEPAGKLDLAWFPAIKEKCDKAGLELMCSAFSPELVWAVDPFIEVHKVASSCLSHVKLLEAVRETGKPVLLSTGASSKADVHLALQRLNPVKTTLLYCNAAYPSTHHNLFQIDALRQEFNLPVGLSDHSLDAVYTPLAAVRFHGATIIEKHFTPIPHIETPDSKHSLDGTDFKIMVDHLRGKADTSAFGPSREEKAMFLRHNVRLVASKDVAPGDLLAYGKNYGAFRSLEDDSHGMSPFFWNHEKGPEGKRAVKAIKAGTGVGPGDY